MTPRIKDPTFISSPKTPNPRDYSEGVGVGERYLRSRSDFDYELEKNRSSESEGGTNGYNNHIARSRAM